MLKKPNPASDTYTDVTTAVLAAEEVKRFNETRRSRVELKREWKRTTD